MRGIPEKPEEEEEEQGEKESNPKVESCKTLNKNKPRKQTLGKP